MNHATLARLCQESYLPDGIIAADCIGGMGPQCYLIGYRPLVIIFRGTADKAGWIQDMMCAPTPCQTPGGGWIHQGFAECWQVLRRRLLREVGSRPCIVAGHSLGGALATLAALDLDCQQVVTFGAPRVGNAVFAGVYQAKVQGRTTRYVHGLDPVPWVPSYLRGYRHVGPAVWLAGGTSSDLTWLPWLVTAVARGLSNWRRLWDEHGIAKYVEVLDKVIA